MDSLFLLNEDRARFQRIRGKDITEEKVITAGMAENFKEFVDKERERYQGNFLKEGKESH